RVRAHFQNLAGWLTSVLEAGVEQGLFQMDKRPEEQAQMLMASVHGAMLSARAFGNAGVFIAVVAPEFARLRSADR
ncbi:TetR/AcrR family transcriptional regulator, partial [Mesorhizobium sp. M1A.T.Ca.IN.004.03.1.1]